VISGTTSPRAKLTGDSGGAFEALLIGDCRLFRSLAENWPLRLLGLLQQYLPAADIATDATVGSSGRADRQPALTERYGLSVPRHSA
jgi:hypothetical protein